MKNVNLLTRDPNEIEFNFLEFDIGFESCMKKICCEKTY